VAALELTGFALVHLTLTALPAAAAALFAARRGVRELPILLAIALAATATVAFLGFWAFFADPLVGESFTYLVVAGSLLSAAVSCLAGIDRAVLRGLAVPAALWALGTIFLLFLGFSHGGLETPLATSISRFSGPLPSDNAIPQFFAGWYFEHGHDGRPPPFPGEWLSSDRPPLQVGFVLWQRTFGWQAEGLNYQVLGVVLQQLWIVGLWALLLAARVGRTTRGLAMVAVLLSNVAIVNGFFVWPKLLPAALLLAAAALVLTPLWERARASLPTAALIGLLCALAMMGHGSSVFGIVALAAVAAFRGLPGWRWLGVAAAVGIVVMGSWSAYQRYEDPPGNRLVKYTLGGVVEIDQRGTLEAIADSYREAGFGDVVDNKVQNFLTIAGGEFAWEMLDAGLEGDTRQLVEALRAIFFFCLVPSLALLLLGPVAMALRRSRGPIEGDEWRFALLCFATVGIGMLAWGLLVFGSLDIRAVVHVGSYLLPILALAGAVVGLRAVWPRFAIWWVALSSLLVLALYVPALTPPPGTAYEPAMFAAAALALAGFCFLALRPLRAPAGGSDG
jgi:hypothetical protein